MTERIKFLLDNLNRREYRNLRDTTIYNIDDITEGFSDTMKDAKRLEFMLENEIPVFFENDRIGFYRSITEIPLYVNSRGERNRWTLGNITPDYGRIITNGFAKVIEDISESRKVNVSDEQREFLDAEELTVRAAIAYCEKYRKAAEERGCTELYNALCRIPMNGASSFYEALVFMKIIIFTIRCNANTHLTIGRFDRYMYPFYEADKKAGVTDEELLEYLEEFFISINADTDLYQGVQLGDNGQSMVLGGCDADGVYRFNGLSELCMKASLELNLIDPKINLRVGKDTPDSLYILGTEMTKKGLGFPQYCNDDVVIPGLVKLGYAPEDAVNYVVAACWEFIIPGKGFDVPNIGTMNFPKAVETVLYAELETCIAFEALADKVDTEIRKECDEHIERTKRYKAPPSPYMSVFVSDCTVRAKDISDCGAVYNNYGIHGAGISCAADALSAIETLVYEEKSVSKKELLTALKADFVGYDELREKLLLCPRMGNNDDYADDIAIRLMKTFSSYLNGKPNGRGGVYRAGTGSAQDYIWAAKKVGATADGRKAADPYGSSFSPSLLTKPDGPLSVIKSFTKFDLSNIINGGPLTLEIHDATFRNEDGIEKVAMLVKAFIKRGGHQLQLNSINREKLLDARVHPEKYPNLIVRVWGWSGYWKELDDVYRDHIIRRTEFSV